MESLYLVFLVVFILLLIIPFNFKIKLSYDAISNTGALSIKILFLYLIIAKLKRKNKDILLITKKKKNEVNVEVGEKEIRFIKFFKNEVSNKIKIKSILIYSKLGLDEPFKAAVFSSSLNNIILFLISKIKNYQPTASLILKDNIVYNDTKLSLAINAIMALSIYDILYSFFVSLFRNKNE